MGWSNQIPNPLVVGGAGQSGRIEVYDASGILLATLDESGLIFYDSTGLDVSTQDQTGLFVYDPILGGEVGVTPGFIYLYANDTLSPFFGTYARATFFAGNQNAPGWAPYLFLSTPSYSTGDWASIKIVAEDVVSGSAPRFEYHGYSATGATGGEFQLLWGLDLQTQDSSTSAIISAPRGFRGGVSSFSASGAIGAETVVLTITSFTFHDGRAYEITHYGGLVTSADGVYADFRVHKTNVAGTMITQYFTYRGRGATGVNIEGSRIVRNPIGGGDITTDVVLTVQVSGAGTVTHHATNFLPRVFWIKDIGDAADYPFSEII